MNINGTQFSVDVYDVLNELKSDLSLHQIHYLRQIKNGPANVQCTCPFHADGNEHKPSFGVSKDTGIGHCFACDTVVDLPELISFCFGRKDMGAYGWQWLRKHYLSIDLDNLPDVFEEEKEDEAPQYVSEEELDSYRWTHPYWAKRGITDEYIIELFDLGYDKSTKSITFPVRDINGNCLFVARRSVRTKYFNYPSGKKKGIFGIYELYQLEQFPDRVFITESMIDCILLWQSGFYACALNGLGSSLQFQQLNSMPCKSFVLATDNDNAGVDARIRLRKYIKGKLLYDLYLPSDVKDIGELYRDEIDNIGEWVKFGPKKIV